MTPLVTETVNLFTLSSFPSERHEQAHPQRVVVARTPPHPIDVAREAVEFVEAVVLHGELQVLRKVAVEFQRVAGGVG